VYKFCNYCYQFLDFVILNVASAVVVITVVAVITVTNKLIILHCKHMVTLFKIILFKIISRM
jgi:hypothetical protein